jgi:1,4-alpha-glucan branching enzyme
VIVAPFDTELFGHWWFEGNDFLAATFRALAQGAGAVRPVTGSRHLAEHPPKAGIRLPAGSWGANGDFSMWLSEQTAWTWERLWALEERFWDVAPAALASDETRPILAQAARELLLAQSSDWQFIISTGAAADYGERRFREHCSDTEELVSLLADGSQAALDRGHRRAAELADRDALFPNVLPAIAAALSGSRSLVLG